MAVNLQVTFHIQIHIKPAVYTEGLHHVVKKPHPAASHITAAAVQIPSQPDIRLLCCPCYLSDPQISFLLSHFLYLHLTAQSFHRNRKKSKIFRPLSFNAAVHPTPVSPHRFPFSCRLSPADSRSCTGWKCFSFSSLQTPKPHPLPS